MQHGLGVLTLEVYLSSAECRRAVKRPPAHTRWRGRRTWTLLLSVGFLLAPGAAHADEKTRCFVLCEPALKLEPTVTVGNLIAPARVQDVTTGDTSTLPREAGLEVILALGIPTQVPRVKLTLESIFPIPGSQPELEAELNLMLLTAEMTGGWVEAHFDIVDKLSPGERPGSEGSYTHKLDLELDVAFLAFNWLPRGNWLRNVELEASLDYLVTGLPRRGDVFDAKRYLDDASGWSVSFLLVLPLAPLAPG